MEYFKDKSIPSLTHECVNILYPIFQCTGTVLHTCTAIIFKGMYIDVSMSLPLHSYCGMKDPSWTELRNFVCFLDKQLESYEQSVLSSETVFGDNLADIRSFVFRFMIEMSTVGVKSNIYLHFNYFSNFFLVALPPIFCMYAGLYYILTGLCYIRLEGRGSS